ncbi:hypothetical protein [Gynuella sp.]|uniref:spermine/spermidine synthase domain-containing protein n=1 Tax=Gynuella sp. TaxID=2969146 RepID=UPI003D0FCA0C
MALLWFQQKDGHRYEVRSAGKTLRLYSDGVFHSQYNPGRLSLGGLWDLLYLPAFSLPPEQLNQVLLLGLGGGSVVHPLNYWFVPESIDAVEIEASHLHVAREFFRIEKENLRLHHADALQWLPQQSQQWDIVIEDVYGHLQGEPVRGVEYSRHWSNELLDHLSPHGLLIMNFTAARDMREWLSNMSEWRAERLFFLQLQTNGYLNRVLVVSRYRITPGQLRHAVPAALKKLNFKVLSV